MNFQFTAWQENMVERQLASRGIRNDNLLSVMSKGAQTSSSFVALCGPTRIKDRPLPDSMLQLNRKSTVYGCCYDSNIRAGGWHAVLEISFRKWLSDSCAFTTLIAICGLERHSELLDQILAKFTDFWV